MPKNSNGPGRPRADDPKIHLPNITINESTINQMAAIQKENPRLSLSEHYQKALDNYIYKYYSSASGRVVLGFPKHK